MRLLVRLLLCVLAGALGIYLYMDAHNALTEVRLAIPQVQKELRELREENKRLAFEVAKFESPDHLMQLARKPEYSHLKPCFETNCVKIRIRADMKDD